MNNLQSEDPERISWTFVSFVALGYKKVSYLDLRDEVLEPGTSLRKRVKLPAVAGMDNRGHNIGTTSRPSPLEGDLRQSIRVSTIASPYWSPTLAPRHRSRIAGVFLGLCGDGDEYSFIY